MSPRVLQIPGDHPYVVQSCPPAYRLSSSPTRIPSPALTPGWLSEHRAEFDVVHLHFGYEHMSPQQLGEWIATLRELWIPLVLTVHDLRNPHQATRHAHDEHLDHLVPAASAVLTLTTGAAAEILDRWGVCARVVSHPAVFGPGAMVDASVRSALATKSSRVVGIHFKSLRRNVVEPDRVTLAVLEGVSAAGGRLRIDVHPETAGHPGLRRTRRLARDGHLDLRVHERFDDRELAAYLASLHTYVLPHRFGTHSGWLEACRDLGTRVVAPSCGYYADQWSSVVSYVNDENAGLDVGSLKDAVARSLSREPLAPAGSDTGPRRRSVVRSVHADVYDAVTALEADRGAAALVAG
ncbi:glycosyltransferase family 1 protein [Kineosporia succinea]|uniref:Glycosyl transferase family 4 n=1 Tax=Kineosporia succinea TaxID=84632 RepID=A0ABT9PET5_9ACTN|nr:glycosyltransferase family 1 protein [Kineosporia succinea]MDP9831220.1 hypothetical protein [Kineosporia succinea]